MAVFESIHTLSKAAKVRLWGSCSWICHHLIRNVTAVPKVIGCLSPCPTIRKWAPLHKYQSNLQEGRVVSVPSCCSMQQQEPGFAFVVVGFCFFFIFYVLLLSIAKSAKQCVIQ